MGAEEEYQEAGLDSMRLAVAAEGVAASPEVGLHEAEEHIAEAALEGRRAKSGCVLLVFSFGVRVPVYKSSELHR